MQLFCKIAILKNFAKFTRKHLCWNLSFFSDLQPETLSNYRLLHRCFCCKFSEVFKNVFFIKHLRPIPKFRPTLFFFWPQPKFNGPTPPTLKFQPTPPTPFFLTQAKMLWTHAKIWPRPPTHPHYPRHPRYLAESVRSRRPDVL